MHPRTGLTVRCDDNLNVAEAEFRGQLGRGGRRGRSWFPLLLLLRLLPHTDYTVVV